VTTGSVVIDLQAIQSPGSPEWGIGRYACDLVAALEFSHPRLVGRYLLNPDLPPPSDLGPLEGSRKLTYAGTPDSIPERARVFHSLSPLHPGVPVTRVWPRWTHERGLQFCATVHDPIGGGKSGNPWTNLRERTARASGLEVLRAADALLTTSTTVSRSLVSRLGIDPHKLHMVGAGADPRFAPSSSQEDAHSRAVACVPGLEPLFVLCPSAEDTHANVEALIVAFSRLPEELRNTRQLVLSGRLPAPTADHFLRVAAAADVAARVLFAGHLPEEAVLHLYQAAELVCVPSLLEGSDIPVAQALGCGAVTIMSGRGPSRNRVAPGAQFDPFDPDAISAAIQMGLCDEAFRETSRRHARDSRATWTDVANRTAAVYETLMSRPLRPWRRRRRLAIVSPFPPVTSGIANYSFRLVEELATLSDRAIDCFADGLERSPEPPSAPSGLAVYDARNFQGVEAATGGYDEVVYVLGNSEFHAAALASLRNRHGLVLAHEVMLGGLYRFAEGSRAAVPGDIEESRLRIYGPPPEEPGSLGDDPASGTNQSAPLMAREVIGLSDRFLVTSGAAAGLARVEAGPGLAERVGVLDFATELQRSRGSSRPKIATIGQDTRVLASFGIVDPIKKPHDILRSFALLAPDYLDLVLALVGPVSEELDRELQELGATLGLAGRVFITGRVDPGTYLGWLDRCELAVQLRASFQGEASAAVGDCLACGVPMVVTDLGWMGGLPDDVVVKVPVGASPEELAETCRKLLDDSPRRGGFGEKARAYAGAHTFKDAARALVEVLDETYAMRR
jgi:glycosyltransferase involved in cell wall biosynthesis